MRAMTCCCDGLAAIGGRLDHWAAAAGLLGGCESGFAGPVWPFASAAAGAAFGALATSGGLAFELDAGTAATLVASAESHTTRNAVQLLRASGGIQSRSQDRPMSGELRQ